MRYGLRVDEPVTEDELNDALEWLRRLNHVQLLRVQTLVDLRLDETALPEGDPGAGDPTLVMKLDLDDLAKKP